METPCLFLYHQSVAKLIDHASSCFPAEACGLIAGKKNKVQTIMPVRNIEKRLNRFKMDPEEQIRAFVDIKNSCQDLLAIYHSHPDGSSRLSQIDLDNFFYPGVFSVLLYSIENDWKLKAYRIVEKNFDEITLIFSNLA